MTDESEIREAVREAAADGSISCAAALAVADRLGVAPKRVGEACNEEGVKIAHCQLGCFP
ncbi:MAG: hypothetical protein ACOC7T_05430 [Planctomycetota bacterium]